jgi:hypothetical protein
MTTTAGFTLAPFTRGKIVRADARKKRFCPVCRGGGWPCYWREDGTLAGCGNVSSSKRDREGNCWVHVLRFDSDERPKPRLVAAPPPAPKHASAEHKHLVYSALLDRLSVRPDLSVRGLSDDDVGGFGYRRTPDFDTSVLLARQLSDLGLSGVPGFFNPGPDVGWRMVHVKPGFFVPVRNSRGQIHGLMYRLDVPEGPKGKIKYKWLSSHPDHYKSGTSSGTPYHFARHDLLAASSSVWLTEGALKSDIAARYLNEPFVAAPGVTMWSGFAEKFKAAFPHVTQAIVAFDTDWSRNPDVRRGLGRLLGELRAASFNVVVRSWPSRYKGIDDYMLALSHRNAPEVAA